MNRYNHRRRTRSSCDHENSTEVFKIINGTAIYKNKVCIDFNIISYFGLCFVLN
jgi:hypothetical protein